MSWNLGAYKLAVEQPVSQQRPEPHPVGLSASFVEAERSSERIKKSLSRVCSRLERGNDTVEVETDHLLLDKDRKLACCYQAKVILSYCFMNTEFKIKRELGTLALLTSIFANQGLYVLLIRLPPLQSSFIWPISALPKMRSRKMFLQIGRQLRITFTLRGRIWQL